ncbi:MAG: BlaI/MecI/CopY family transcriptional regulator [Pirellulales bacterium]|nr:BlaI/MecI/CopY family transcriptional regulator [Pirellulales bacterium]
MCEQVTPTQRELEILKILWDRDAATVRQVYEIMRQRSPIVQNTVQAFLRTMEEKGLVTHELRGRAFVYRPMLQQKQTARQLVGRLLDRVYDGAMDQLVDGLLSIRRPTEEELQRLEMLINQAKNKPDP